MLFYSARAKSIMTVWFFVERKRHVEEKCDLVTSHQEYKNSLLQWPRYSYRAKGLKPSLPRFCASPTGHFFVK